jgi:geranylgeranyl pyrophosphate synthase
VEHHDHSLDWIGPLKNRLDLALAEVCKGEPAALYEPMAYILNAGGKRLRPILLLLSCQSAGGTIDDGFKAALAVELLHTFTLVHDDIMDRDDLRRGLPTVHKKWDESTAILAGDGLVTLAFKTLMADGHPELLRVMRRFAGGLLILCEGQALDKAFEVRSDVKMDEYLDMIRKKTATLLEMACEAGAVLGNGGQEAVNALAGFGHALGMAFQIQDDLLDILSDEAVSGKPTGSDITAKKKTCLSIHFRENAAVKDAETFDGFWGRPLSGPDIIRVRELFERSGSIGFAEEAVSRWISECLKHLGKLSPSESGDRLIELTRALIQRTA